MPSQKRKTEEVSILRRRTEELEDELRQLRTAIDGKEGVVVPKPSTSSEDVLDVLKSKGRGSSQNFKISTWDNERKESRASSSVGSEIVPISEAVVAIDASSNPTEIQAQNEVTTLRPAHETKPVISRSQKSLWIAQPGFGISCPGDLMPHVLISGLDNELTAAAFETTVAKLQTVFDQHLRNQQHPHLAFSSAIVSLYHVLCKEKLQQPGSNSHSVDGVDEACCLLCAKLVRHFIGKSRFSDQPPSRRPTDIERRSYVRELCTQAGLSLDLVRIGYVCKNRLSNRTSSASHASEPRDLGNTSSSEGCKKLEACVTREEIHSHLVRAGRYLAAVQMDMDRFRDEFEDRARTLGSSQVEASNLKGNEQSLALQDDVPASATDSRVDFTPLRDSQTPESVEVSDSSREKDVGSAAESQVALVNSFVSPVASRKSFDASSMAIPDSEDQNTDSFRNPLLVPSLGEFLDQQVLPLYVADVPFDKLKALTETYCGVSLDSDDEREARDVVGLPMPAATKTRPKKRRRISRENSIIEQTPGDSVNQTKLKELCELSRARSNVPVMRAQMQTSIVEKRRKGFKVINEEYTSTSAQSKVPRKTITTPLVKTANALFHGTTPLASGFSTQALPFPECSPLSVRRTSRGLSDLQASVRSTRSQNHSRTPRTTSQPDWDAM